MHDRPGLPKRTSARAGSIELALAEIWDPVGLVRAYLHRQGLLPGPAGWTDDLIDVGISSVVDAALSWNPDRWDSVLPWVYFHLRRDVGRELRKQTRWRAELGAETCAGADIDRWMFDPGTRAFERVELRIDLQRWADLACLSTKMRYAVETYALSDGRAKPGTTDQVAANRLRTLCADALKHMRTAAITGQRRDDRWTRARAKAVHELDMSVAAPGGPPPSSLPPSGAAFDGGQRQTVAALSAGTGTSPPVPAGRDHPVDSQEEP